MDLELVEHGGECELRGSGAMDQYVLLTGRLLGLGHRGLDVGDVRNQWPLCSLAIGLMTWEDEDRYTVVDPGPNHRDVEGSPTGDDCAGGHDLTPEVLCA